MTVEKSSRTPGKVSSKQKAKKRGSNEENEQHSLQNLADDLYVPDASDRVSTDSDNSESDPPILVSTSASPSKTEKSQRNARLRDKGNVRSEEKKTGKLRRISPVLSVYTSDGEDAEPHKIQEQGGSKVVPSSVMRGTKPKRKIYPRRVVESPMPPNAGQSVHAENSVNDEQDEQEVHTQLQCQLFPPIASSSSSPSKSEFSALDTSRRSSELPKQSTPLFFNDSEDDSEGFLGESRQKPRMNPSQSQGREREERGPKISSTVRLSSKGNDEPKRRTVKGKTNEKRRKRRDDSSSSSSLASSQRDEQAHGTAQELAEEVEDIALDFNRKSSN